jgi:hypothetical protein
MKNKMEWLKRGLEASLKKEQLKGDKNKTKS